jgi:hypothetical protein
MLKQVSALVSFCFFEAACRKEQQSGCRMFSRSICLRIVSPSSCSKAGIIDAGKGSTSMKQQ